MSGEYVDGSYFFYAPSKGAAIFFTIAFLAVTCIHSWQSSHYTCWKLTPLFPFCGLLFTAGFALRIYGAWNYDNLDTFIASVCLIYASPPLLELQNYHILGRILYYVPYHSPLHPGRILTTFGFVSAIIEALNGWGASYSANQSLSDGEIEIGHNLIKASLLMQLVVISCFVVLTGIFHRRCSKAGIHNRRLSTPLIVLYVSIGLILIRTIFRTIEYFGVANLRYDEEIDADDVTPLIRYEGYFYGFEASLMLINCVMFNVFHPRRYLPLNNKIYLTKDAVTEVEGPGYEDPRPFWQTLLDPFDLIGLVKGRKNNQTEEFWEAEEGGAASSGIEAGDQTRKADEEAART